MADSKSWSLEIWIKIRVQKLWKRNNFSKGSSESKKDDQVIQVWGWQPHKFLTSKCH